MTSTAIWMMTTRQTSRSELPARVDPWEGVSTTALLGLDTPNPSPKQRRWLAERFRT